MAETLKEIREKLQSFASEHKEPDRKKVSFDEYKTWKYLQGASTNKKLREHVLFPNSKGYQPSNELECPYCGGGNTHHVGVEIFDNSEDSKQGDHFTFWCKESYGWNYLGYAEGMDVAIPKDTFDNDCSNNRGFRRGSIQLHCVCEECSQMFSIVVAQMRGTTQAGVERNLG